MYMDKETKRRFHSLVSGFRKRKYDQIEAKIKKGEYDKLNKMKEYNEKLIKDLIKKVDSFKDLEENNN